MPLEWIKDQTNKAVKAVGDEGNSLYKEAQQLVEKAEHKLTATAPEKRAITLTSTEQKPAIVSGPLKLTSGLAIDQKTLEITALKAEAKTQHLQTAQPRYDGSVLDTVSNIVSKAAINTTAVIGNVLGSLGGPLEAGLLAGIQASTTLIKIAEDIYQSADKKLTVSEVKGVESSEIKAGFAKLFNESTEPAASIKVGPSAAEADKIATSKPEGTAPRNLEFDNIFDAIKHIDEKGVDGKGASRVSAQETSMPESAKRWLFNDDIERNSAANNDNLFSYSNDLKGKTEISAVPGHVHIEQRDEKGNLRTIVDKTNGKVTVLKDNESVVQEGDKTVIKGPNYTVSWDIDGNRHIEIGKLDIVRKGDKAEIIDKNAAKISVKKGLVTVADSVTFSPEKGKDLNTLTADALKTLKDGEVHMIAIPGGGTRTILKDGTTIDVLDDKARLTTSDNTVYQLEKKDDKFYLRQGDQLVPLDKAHLDVDGHKHLGAFKLDPRTLLLTTQNYFLDIAKNHQQIVNPAGTVVDAFVHRDNCSTFKIGSSTIENKLDTPKISVTTDEKPGDSDPKPAVKYTIDPITTNIEVRDPSTDKLLLTDTPKNTTIADSKTVIDADRRVHIGDTVVNPDGSVQVDRHTFIDKDMHVSSTGWDSSAAQSTSPLTQAAAQSVASSVSNKASSISGLAKSGVVKWTEVLSLNSALNDVLSLMGSMPAGSQAYAMLQQSYSLLVAAIAEATPKALATQEANAKGVSAAPAIKELEAGKSVEELKAKRAA